MTRHLRQTFTSMERVAGLHEGIPMTECGIEVLDLPDGDVVAKDANCPACLSPAPTLIEEVLALRAWKAKVLAFAQEFPRWDDVPADRLYEVLGLSDA